ncbi:hypothetical protein [Actinomadura rupiterrae]|uniref:hypothetical protein n=1 Tax=Actinomadura rupiterrae TaxID=559627 RepID=UPI0020A55CCF|nr:hypothetical protein [Actinomadura rupiterrae]MCP2343163.1 hypothetical protein [Actinomadura rupiterrae]
MTWQQAAASIAAIVDRRNAAHADRLDEVSDEPLPLIKLIADDPHPADITAALTVLAHLRWELDKHEGALLRAGQAAGVSYRAMGRPLGLDTRQAVRARMQRSLARAAHTGGHVPPAPTLTEEQWVAKYGRQLQDATRDLLKHRHELEGHDIAEDLEDLEASLEAVPAAAGRVRVKRLGVVAARVRYMTDDITGTRTPEARAALHCLLSLVADHREVS